MSWELMCFRHGETQVWIYFTFTFRAFSRHFCPKRLTVIHTFMHSWRWLPCMVPTSTSGAVWGSVSCPGTGIDQRQHFILATGFFLYHLSKHLNLSQKLELDVAKIKWRMLLHCTACMRHNKYDLKQMQTSSLVALVPSWPDTKSSWEAHKPKNLILSVPAAWSVSQ